MIFLEGEPAEIHMTIVVTREETGLQETYEVIAIMDKEDMQNGDNT